MTVRTRKSRRSASFGERGGRISDECGCTGQPDGMRYRVAFGEGGTCVWGGAGVDTHRVHSALEEFHTMVDRSGVLWIS